MPVWRLIALLALAAWSACAAERNVVDARIRSALDVLADVIDPAYQLAIDGCIANERAAVAEEKAGRSSSPETDRVFAAIRGRCDATREAFERLRITHSEAVRLVAEGSVERAAERLAELRRIWLALDERSKP